MNQSTIQTPTLKKISLFLNFELQNHTYFVLMIHQKNHLNFYIFDLQFFLTTKCFYSIYTV